MTAEEQRIADAIRERKIQKKRHSKTGTEHLSQAELNELLDEIAPREEDDEPDQECEPEPVPEPAPDPEQPLRFNPVQAALRRTRSSESYSAAKELIALKREKALIERELLAFTRIVSELESLEPMVRSNVLARLQRTPT